MIRSPRWAVIAFVCFAIAACASDETEVQPKASTSTTTSSTGAGGGATIPEPENHRATAEMCTGDPPMGNAIPMMPGSECEMDAECTNGTNGRCIWPYAGGNVCMYDECSQDSDCGSVNVCRCRGDFGMNRCYLGNCQVDADCPNSWCAPSIVGPTCMEGISPGSIGYFCRTADDGCVEDRDCGDDGRFECLFDVDMQSWQCLEVLCTG